MSPSSVQPDNDPLIRRLRTLRDRFVLIYLAALIAAVALAPRFRSVTEERFEVDVNPGLESIDAPRPGDTYLGDPLFRERAFSFPVPLRVTLDEEPIVETSEPLSHQRGFSQDLDATAALLLSPPFELWPSDASASVIDADAWLREPMTVLPAPAYLVAGGLGTSSASSGGAGGSGATTAGGSTLPGMEPITRAPSAPVSDVPARGLDSGIASDSGGGNTYQTDSELPADDGPNGGSYSTNPQVSVPEPSAVLFAGLGVTFILTRRLRARVRKRSHAVSRMARSPV